MSMRHCAAVAALLLVGCVNDVDTDTRPRVLAVSKRSVALGETLYIAATGVAAEQPIRGRFAGTYSWRDDDGQQVVEEVVPFTRALVFDGTFETDGAVDDVTVAAGTSLLRWNRFGPFDVPFGGRGRATGAFSGTLQLLIDGDNGVVEGPTTAIEIDVKPSIVVHRLEPVIGRDEGTNTAITAGCGAPALRVLPGLAYVLEVEAIGITPTSFSWSISNVNGNEGMTTFSHDDADGDHRDVLGDGARGEMVVTNGIVDGADTNVMTIDVVAFGADGEVVETVVPVDVVRPIQFFYDGNRELAEYYEPELVNGPIVGGIGTVITYSESHSESRQRGVSVNVTRTAATSNGTTSTDTWNDAYGVTDTLTTTNTASTATSETNQTSQSYGESYNQSSATQVGLSSTNGTNWGWSMVQGTTQETYQQAVDSMSSATTGTVITELGGAASVPGLAGVSGKVGSESALSNEVGQSVTAGTRTGARTDRGTSSGGSASSTASYGSVTTDGRSTQVGGTWGLAKQNAITQSTAESEASANSVVFSTGGSDAVTTGYTEGVSQAWTETWQSTSTDQTLVSFSGKVPNGRCAVVYRQTVRTVRTAWVWQHDLCGVRSDVGELLFNEWSWSPNIAIGDDCTAEVPPSTQPPAACFIGCQ
jgi:hypothetical protein